MLPGNIGRAVARMERLVSFAKLRDVCEIQWAKHPVVLICVPIEDSIQVLGQVLCGKVGS